MAASVATIQIVLCAGITLMAPSRTLAMPSKPITRKSCREAAAAEGSSDKQAKYNEPGQQLKRVDASCLNKKTIAERKP